MTFNFPTKGRKIVPTEETEVGDAVNLIKVNCCVINH